MKQWNFYLGVLGCLLSTAACSQSNSKYRLPKNADSLFILKKESRFYANIHAGGTFALGSTFKFYPDDITSISVKVLENKPPVTTVNYKATSKGLGDGFRYGVGLSYIVNDFINIGIDVDYFHSTISKVKDSSYSELNANNTVNYAYNQHYTIAYDASLLTFAPNITFKAISQPRFFIYNKIGAIITIRPNSIQREQQKITTERDGQGLPDSTALTQKRYDWGLKNPAFGFMGGIGAQVKLQERIRAFAEIQFSHILFQVRSRTLTEFNVNGREIVSSLPVSERETEFKKDVTTNGSVNTNMPSEDIVQRFPVTYVGFQLGLVYRF